MSRALAKERFLYGSYPSMDAAAIAATQVWEQLTKDPLTLLPDARRYGLHLLLLDAAAVRNITPDKARRPYSVMITLEISGEKIRRINAWIDAAQSMLRVVALNEKEQSNGQRDSESKTEARRIRKPAAGEGGQPVLSSS